MQCITEAPQNSIHIGRVMCSLLQLIYITRNPRDVCVSFYNHWKIFEGFTGSFETFADAFVNDVVGYNCPFFQNVLEFWKVRHEPNVLFVTYEEMKADLRSVISKLADFLGKKLSSSDIDRLEDHVSFNKMSKNKAVNKAEVVKVRRSKT